jgi:hypothetical protein
MKKSRAPVTFATVRRFALSLQNVEEGTCYGFPAFRTGGKLFAVFREDLNSIVVRASFEERDEMIAADSKTYYTTDHHRPYQWVLARLSEIHPDAIPDLLLMSWRSSASKKRKSAR